MISVHAVHTFTGILFDPFNPKVDDIRIEDIAHSLAMQCRFTGHTRRRWSVGQHSMMVSDLCPDNHKLWGLLHDAAEAYLVDLPRPIKRHPCMEVYRKAETLVERAIADRFDLYPCIPSEVHRADNIMLRAEADAFMHGTDGWFSADQTRPFWDRFGQSDYDCLVAYLRTAPQTADETIRDQFLIRFRELDAMRRK